MLSEITIKFKFLKKIFGNDPKDMVWLFIEKNGKKTRFTFSFIYFSVEFLKAIKREKLAKPFFYEPATVQGSIGLIPQKEKLAVHGFYYFDREKNEMNDPQLEFIIENQEEFCKKMVKAIRDTIRSSKFKRIEKDKQMLLQELEIKKLLKNFEAKK